MPVEFNGQQTMMATPAREQAKERRITGEDTIYGGHDNREFIHRTIDVGAGGFVSKSHAPTAVTRAARGKGEK